MQIFYHERKCYVYACMCCSINNTCLYNYIHKYVPINCLWYLHSYHMQPICIVLDEEEKDIPHPFQLPKYSMDVEIALQQGKLLATTYQKFISGTARALLSYKRHPTPDERNRVASEIVGKYPFLKSPGNKPEVRIYIYTMQCCRKPWLHAFSMSALCIQTCTCITV